MASPAGRMELQEGEEATTVKQVKKGRMLTHEQEVFDVHAKAKSKALQPSWISIWVSLQCDPVVRILVRDEASEIVPGDENRHEEAVRKMKPN